MNSHRNPSLMQVGIYLLLAGLLITVAAHVGAALLPLANLMIIVGVLLAIVAAVMPKGR